MLVATNLACVHRMRRWVLTFEFVITANERDRGGAGFALARLVGRSCGEGWGTDPDSDQRGCKRRERWKAYIGWLCIPPGLIAPVG